MGAEEFSLRERATTQLIEMGVAAKNAVEAGRTHPDREIRYRCERIFQIVGELDFQRRLTAFTAGRSDGLDLPGWRRFRDLYGDGAETRSLFAEMQKAESELMQAVERGPQGVARVAETRVAQLQQLQRRAGETTSLGSVTALLFAAVGDDVAHELRVVEVTGANRIPMLQSGQIDIIIANSTATLERAKAIDFTLPYLRAGVKVLVQRGSGIGSVEDLNGRKVVVGRGGTGEQLVKRLAPGAQLVYVDSYAPEGILLMRQGRADAALEDNSLIDYTAKQYPERLVALPERRGEEWVVADDPADSAYAKPAMEAGGGALVSTARDYMRFTAMLAGEGETRGVRLLRPDTVRLARSNMLPMGLSMQFFGNVLPGMGHGAAMQVPHYATGMPAGVFGWGGAAGFGIGAVHLGNKG